MFIDAYIFLHKDAYLLLHKDAYLLLHKDAYLLLPKDAYLLLFLKICLSFTISKVMLPTVKLWTFQSIFTAIGNSISDLFINKNK